MQRWIRVGERAGRARLTGHIRYQERGLTLECTRCPHISHATLTSLTSGVLSSVLGAASRLHLASACPRPSDPSRLRLGPQLRLGPRLHLASALGSSSHSARHLLASASPPPRVRAASTAPSLGAAGLLLASTPRQLLEAEDPAQTREPLDKPRAAEA